MDLDQVQHCQSKLESPLQGQMRIIRSISPQTEITKLITTNEYFLKDYDVIGVLNYFPHYFPFSTKRF